MKSSAILKEISNLVLPAIFLFALYVQFHGDYGPGGGFQAGVIFAVGVILYALLYGLQRSKRAVTPQVVQTLLALGVLIYVGTGYVAFFLGHTFLDYSVFGHGHIGQERGILLVELGVGITVAAAMIAIFYAFAGREE